MPDNIAHDHVHVDHDEADAAILDAPEQLPAPAVGEPVAIGAGVSVLAVVTTLVAADVPWYGAVAVTVVLVVVAAWQRRLVTPAR